MMNSKQQIIYMYIVRVSDDCNVGRWWKSYNNAPTVDGSSRTVRAILIFFI